MTFIATKTTTTDNEIHLNKPLKIAQVQKKTKDGKRPESSEKNTFSATTLQGFVEEM